MTIEELSRQLLAMQQRVVELEERVALLRAEVTLLTQTPLAPPPSRPWWRFW